MDIPEELLTKMWNEKDFEKISRNLFRKQQEINRFAMENNNAERVKLQEELISNLNFRCLAVNHVANNAKSAGVDGVMWTSSADKMAAALELNAEKFEASPLRIWRVKQKNNGKVRRYAIPTMHDRAMCVLMGYSLLPVAEAHADKTSFGCRKGRSRYDAHAYLVNKLKGREAPEYVVVTDVKAYYSSISHEWLMKNIPINKNVLHELLNANIVEAGELFPRDEKGISEGSSLSPYIGNYVLDGLQSYIYCGLYGAGRSGSIDYANGNVTRYVDDIAVTVRSKEDGRKVLNLIEQFMRERGLTLKEEKTGIFDVSDGFDYLKYHIIKRNGVVVSYPSITAVEHMKADLLDVINANLKNQRQLIEALNVKLRAWGNGYRYCESKVIFEEIDNYLDNALLDAMQKLHSYSDLQTIREQFWFTNYLGRKYFALPKESDVRVMHLADTPQLKYTPVKIGFNPYVDVDYLEERLGVTAVNNVTSKYQPIWNRQGGRCYYCGHSLLPDQPIKLITVNQELAETMANKAYIHRICAKNEFVYLQTLDDLDGMSARKLDDMLTKESGLTTEKKKKIEKKLKRTDWKYWKLQEFFKNTKKNHVALTFVEIEKISGQKLSEPMYKLRVRWQTRYDNASTIADAWDMEGFEIVHLDLTKQIVEFERRISGRAKLNIPKVLLENDLPIQVKEEIEHYLNNIVKERGIVKKKDYF